jgi:hypothetical protein
VRSLFLLADVALSSLAVTQSLSLKPNSVQYVTLVNGVDGMVRPGGRVVLWVKVTPNPGKRVYAAGAKDFQPVTLVMTPHAAITPSAPAYSTSELDGNSGSPTPVPVYRREFRIAVPIVISPTAKHNDTLTVGAAINYQACDDRLCYPATSIPVLWKLGLL